MDKVDIFAVEYEWVCPKCDETQFEGFVPAAGKSLVCDDCNSKFKLANEHHNREGLKISY